jgi:hypothetical protein
MKNDFLKIKKNIILIYFQIKNILKITVIAILRVPVYRLWVFFICFIHKKQILFHYSLMTKQAHMQVNTSP